MISYDNDSIPTKTDSTDAPTIAVDGATILTTNGQIEMTDTTDATTGLVSGLPISGKDDGGQTTSTSSASSTIPTQRLTNRIFNTIQFQQRTKYLRDVWAQHIASLNKDFSQFFVVILVCVMGIAFSIAAILTNHWICDWANNNFFGLWNTCFMAPSAITKNVTNTTGSVTVQNMSMSCAIQGLSQVTIGSADQSRLDQVHASQWLIVTGLILYICSVGFIGLVYKFMQISNMNYLRNTLVICLFTQIICFLLFLVGLFLFIWTENFSISITILFVYFIVAIFATNIVNFITIEYKSCKMRQITV